MSRFGPVGKQRGPQRSHQPINGFDVMAVAEDNALLPVSTTHSDIWIHYKKLRWRAILILRVIPSHQPVEQVAGHSIVFSEKHIGRMPRRIELIPPILCSEDTLQCIAFPLQFPKDDDRGCPDCNK